MQNSFLGVDLSYFIAGANDPFTVDKFPTATCDHEEQINVLYIDPETRLRGPLPIRRYPPLRGRLCADYNANNESECMCAFYNPTPPPLPVILGFNSHESYAIRYLLKKYNNFAVTVSSAGDCFNGSRCRPMQLFQLVDIKIAGYRHDQPGRANISGFVAMRDTVEPLRNYVYMRDVNNCEAISVNRKTVMPFSWKSVVDFNPFCNHGTVFLLTNSRG